MPKGTITVGLLAALVLALMSPSVVHADEKSFSCQGGETCVKAILTTFGVTCSTTSGNQPRCKAAASVGASAKLTGKSCVQPCNPLLWFRKIGGRVTYQAVAEAYGVGGLISVRGTPIYIPAPQTKAASGEWTDNNSPPAEVKTISSNLLLGAAPVTGPVGGCLKYTATFFVFAQAAAHVQTIFTFVDVDQDFYRPPASSSFHQHQVSKTHCV
jgi:hypothetical protein